MFMYCLNIHGLAGCSHRAGSSCSLLMFMKCSDAHVVPRYSKNVQMFVKCLSVHELSGGSYSSQMLVKSQNVAIVLRCSWSA
jgi:hypothetical protein